MPTCWICLEEERADRPGTVLSRECSCRGEAGHVHMACICEYAKSKTEQAIADMESGKQREAPTVFHNIRHLWSYCPNCEQYYTGIFAISLAHVFVDYTNELNLDEAEMRSVLAKLTLGGVFMRESMNDVAYEIFSELRHLAERRFDEFPVFVRHLFEYEIYNQLVEIEESRKDYVAALSLSRHLLERIAIVSGQNDPMYSMWKAKVDDFNARVTGGSSSLSTIAALREELKFVKLANSEAPDLQLKFQIERDLSKELFKDGQWLEAICIAKDSLERAKRALGPDHNLTNSFRKIASQDKCMYSRFFNTLREEGKELCVGYPAVAASIRGYSESSGLNDRFCFVTKLTKGDMYVSYVDQGRSTGDGAKDHEPLKKCKLAPSNVRLRDGTKVFCKGLTALPDGTEGEIVSFRESLDPPRYVTKLDQDQTCKLIRLEKVRVKFG